MLDIPYEKNRGKACALACATMVARYYFPGTTWDDIAKIVQWQPGYVVWPFRFWLWLIEHGVRVVDYDLIDYEAWAEKGLNGLKESVPEKEFEYYENNSKDLSAYSEDIKRLLVSSNFTYHRRKPEFGDLLRYFEDGWVCELTLDAQTLDREEGFSLHRVVVLDITDKDVIFHDPRLKVPRPARKESIELVKQAWLSALDAPELCLYKKS